MNARYFLAAAFAVSVVAGCSERTSSRPRSLTPEAFSSPGAADAGNPGTTPGGTGPVDAGESPRPAVRVPINGKSAQPPRSDAATPPPGSDAPLTTDNAQPTTQNNLLPVAPPARPTTVGASSGQFLTLGGVVAEVNGTPIYANKILALLDPVFRTKARQMPLERFRREAAMDIRNEIMAQIRIELEYAAAQRNLDADDKRMAEMMTIAYRQRKKTEAGGSLEVARRKAQQEHGMPFEEVMAEQGRIELARIFYQKKVWPRVQVTANDIRNYYDKNIEKFTANEKVKFRILKVAVKDAPTKEQAIHRVTEMHRRAKAGEDFEAMVMRENKESVFQKPDMGEMAPSSFGIAPVREALAKLRPGDISDVIQDKDAWYVVQLIERKPGHVQPLEDPEVQRKINTQLRTEQFRVLREKHQNELAKRAIITTNEQMMTTALDMALQRYSEYASAK